MSAREWYVFVSLGRFPERPRTWVVPRDHVAAATWIAHLSWLRSPDVPAGRRNAGIESARVGPEVWAAYEDRWDLLDRSAFEAPVLLPHWMRSAVSAVGLPANHRWIDALPPFASSSGQAAGG